MSLYLALYKTFLSKRYNTYLKRAGGNTDKCHEALLYGTYYEEYDYYDFAHKSAAERRTYVTDAWRNKICRRINDRRQQSIIMDKYRTAIFFNRYYGRAYMLVSSSDDRYSFLKFVQNEASVVAKPTNDCAGRGVELLKGHTSADWNNHFDHIIAAGRPYIVEQLITQHTQMARWNISSVNTIRVNTMIRNGKVDFITANIRVGRVGAFVDNCAQGGLCANIDPTNGVIITTACGHDEHRFSEHPDSHMPFVGNQVPLWQQLLKTVAEMALMLPKLRYCSWDFALTDKGWVLVEANKGELIADQRNLQRGLRNEFTL